MDDHVKNKIARMAATATPQMRERMLRMAEMVMVAQETPAARIIVAESAAVVEACIDRDKITERG